MNTEDFQPDPTPPAATTGPAATSDERTLALLTHLSALLHMPIPVFAVIAPIIVWRSRRRESVFVADHAVEAVNFQITLVIYSLAFLLLGFITCGVGFIISGLVYVLGLVGMILAALAANRGDFYRYPMTLRLIHDNFADLDDNNPYAA